MKEQSRLTQEPEKMEVRVKKNEERQQRGAKIKRTTVNKVTEKKE